MASDIARLAAVNARLRLIEIEGLMNTQDVILKNLPSVRVASLSAVAASYAPEDIGPTITPLYHELHQRVEQAGVAIIGPGVAYYAPASEDGSVTVSAGLVVSAEPGPQYSFDVVDLPAAEAAATLVHHGSMDNADETYQALARWIDENGYRAEGSGFAREVYLHCPEELSEWVTEMQIIVSR